MVADQTRNSFGDAWIVVAAYNEAAVIREVLDELFMHYANVLVVDDGSADETSQLAQSAGAAVVRHPVNLGQGAALQTGIDLALRLGADYIVTFDADGQHDPADIGALIRALQTSSADIALGSRFKGTSTGISLSRRLLLKGATLFTFLTTGIWLSDAHNGLRAFSAAGARRIRIAHNRMAHASELMAQIGSKKLKYVEVPVKIRYTEYSKRKGQTSLDAVNIVLDLVAGRLGR